MVKRNLMAKKEEEEVVLQKNDFKIKGEVWWLINFQ